MRVRNEADEVAIAGFVFGEENEMVVYVLAAGGAFLFQPAAGSDVNFAADDRLDALSAGGLVEIDGAVKHAVVRDRKRAKIQLVRAVHELVQPARAIEQRVLGVQMEMDEIGARH